MPPPSQAAQVALVRRFQPALARISLRTAVAMGTLWGRLPSYDKTDIATLTKRSTSVTSGAKAATTSLAIGFYSSLAAVKPPKIGVNKIQSDLDLRAGFLAYWHALSVGRPYIQAVAAGRSATEASAQRFITSTARLAGDVVMEEAGSIVVRWRRVLDGSACEWCALVASRSYKSAESADFGHARCGCTVVPLFKGGGDPAEVINGPITELLEDLDVR